MYATANLPAGWHTPEGFPRSWRHFEYAMAFLGRSHLRTTLARAEAVRLANLEKEEWGEFQRDTHLLTGAR